MNHRYPDGLDCAWITSDRNGNIGAFFTAGVGPIPTHALDQAALAVEDIEERLWDLPSTSSGRLLVTVKRPDDFIAMAERGFFVYDWSDVHRVSRDMLHAYEAMAVPLRPITTRALPEDLAVLSVHLRLSEVVFAHERLVDVRKYLPCREVA
ncbi:hypothetical protein [Polyangium sp. 15x6]|uniref:hypothetical protein n=1 Tax=Polyangium sp. 15x6 TaxID=3042687 RepID=UPI00249B5733|nr:hypothetical protein [Polyangium sp. 15x6]MDI3282661.1 hypothetical protein [Polyangium sp. 15x6]